MAVNLQRTWWQQGGTWCGRALFAAFIVAVSAGAAAAQRCPAPYSEAVSPQTGPVCSSTCAAGSYPQIEGGNITCTPGYGTPICPEPGDILLLTPNGPTCGRGYTPVATAGNRYACNPGDIRVERPPYLLNGQLTYEACFPGPDCPQGYIATEDPDGALGTNRVCMLPCQDLVMNQAMSCSCGSGGQLASQAPGAPVQQICKPICGPGARWQPSSPLYAFKAEEGTCVPQCEGGTIWSNGQCVPPPPGFVAQPFCPPGTAPQGDSCTTVEPPLCPPSMYWSGQVCLPIGLGPPSGPILIFGNCPPNTYWNGSHCVPNIVLPPICGPSMHWNGLFCVPNGPICPPLQKWNGSQCVPILQPVCPPLQHWNGVQCVPILLPQCPPLQKWNGSKCVPILQPQCPIGQKWDGTKCVPFLPQICPQGQHWDGSKCVPNVPQCPLGQKWDGTKCVPFLPQVCPQGQHWDGSKCVPNVPQCPLGQKWDGTKCVPFLPQVCPQGQHWDGSKCVPNVPQCPLGQKWDGTKCVPFLPQVCPQGQHWNGSQCVPNVPQCPQGEHWNGNQCVPNGPQICPPPHKWINGKCV